MGHFDTSHCVEPGELHSLLVRARKLETLNLCFEQLFALEQEYKQSPTICQELFLLFENVFDL